MRVVPVQKECYYENNVIREHKKQGELFMGFLDKVFGTHSQREVKRIEPIVDKIEAMLGCKAGSITPDGKFSVDATRCVGACGLAPVMMVDDDVYGRLTPDMVGDILKKYM